MTQITTGRQPDAHLTTDELQACFDVLLRFRLILLDEHGPDKLVNGVLIRQRREFLPGHLNT